jgi:hypothetical protein
MNELTTALPKRTWCYLSQPYDFEVAPCQCGNQKTQWSEFEKHIWCDTCQLDFIPKHYGVLDGPIPIRAATLMGLKFDRFNLMTQKVERFNIETCEFDISG